MTVDRDLLGEVAGGASPLAATAPDLIARVRRRRRRRSAVAAGVAGALAAALLGTAVASREPAPVAAPPAGGLSFHGVELPLPSSWVPSVGRCPLPGQGVTERCVTARSPGGESVRVESYHSYAWQEASARPSGSQAITITGRAGELLEGPAGTTTLVIPDLDVAVAATGAHARSLALSVRLARPVDSAGCADPLSVLAPAAAGPAGPLAPTAAPAASVCVYADLRVVGSLRLTPAETASLAQRLNALRPSAVAARCPSTTYRDGYLVRFAGGVDVAVWPDGCLELGVSNGARTARLTPDLIGFLARLTGG